MTSDTAPKTALAYLRVSDDRGREDTLQSPAIQRAAIDAWCAQRGIRVVGEYEDRNRSGGVLTRPGLIAARKLIPQSADGIVVARGNRASRMTIDGLNLIEELKAEGGFIAAADGSIDTSTPMMRMVTTMNFAQAQRELEDVREQAAAVHARAIFAKRRHMGPRPYGYTRDDDHRLAVDDAEAAIVVEVFKRRAAAEGWGQISTDLRARGIRDRYGHSLTAQRLGNIVRRRTYLGEAFHGAKRVVDAHPAIVDEALFAAANRAAPTVASPRKGVSPDVLVGLVRCAGCSYGMSSHRQRNGSLSRACRTTGAGGGKTASHDCDQPAKVSPRENAELVEVVWERATEMANAARARRADEHPDRDRGEAMIAEAKAGKDEIATVEMRRSLGERWAPMMDELDELEQRGLEIVHDAEQPAVTPAGELLLATERDGLDLDEAREALRAVVQAVFVRSGDAPLADRVDVVGNDAVLDVPRPGRRGVARRWVGLV